MCARARIFIQLSFAGAEQSTLIGHDFIQGLAVLGLILVFTFANLLHLVHFASKVSVDSSGMSSLVDGSTPVSHGRGLVGQEYFVLPALQVKPCQFEQRMVFCTGMFVAQYVVVLISLFFQATNTSIYR